MKEPNGWDFETVAWFSKPVSDTYWFIPWSNTEFCEDEIAPPTASKTKLLIYTTGVLDPAYRGTGIIVDEKEGHVVGCYKVHLDTPKAEETKTELYAVKGDLKFNPSDQQRILNIPERNRSKDQKDELNELQEEAEDWSLEVRRLNGELLDPRPAGIALHDPRIFHVHPDMATRIFKDYGNEYRALELRLRELMGSVFDAKKHLPAYRQKEEGLEADGVQLPAADLQNP